MNTKRTLIGMLICAAILYLGSSCGGGGSESGSAENTADGKAVFNQYCSLCHGEDGKREANGAKDLTLSQMPLKERVAMIKDGKNLMTPFEGILTPEQMEAAAKYSMTLK